MQFSQWIAAAVGGIVRTRDALIKGLSSLTAQELSFFGIVLVLSFGVLYALFSLAFLRSRLSDLKQKVRAQESALGTLKAAVQEHGLAVDNLNTPSYRTETAGEKLDAALATLEAALDTLDAAVDAQGAPVEKLEDVVEKDL